MFLTFFPNFIINLIAINLTVINLTFIKLVSIASSFAVITNPTILFSSRIIDLALPEVFNIEISGIAIQLYPWMN